MSARLYVMPGSHPLMTGRLLLARKGIELDGVALRVAPHYPGHPRSVLPAELLRSATARGAEAA
jgi:hypothetical protein